MTNEEKAKAYDEALAKCKAYIEDTAKRWSEEFCKATKIVFEDIFPQLAENEDERIRKELIDWIKGGSTYDWQENKEKWIAYLERQKDTTSVLSLQQVYREGFDNAIKAVKQNPEKYGFPKEQKPSTPKFRVGDVMRTKQESAEGITDGLPVIVSVDNLYYHCTNELISISNQEEYEFPPMNRRQKERVADSSKTSAEWSEEDIKHLNSILYYLNRPFHDMSEEELADFNWLQSLRPQPHWKPSEEQMIALHKAAQESPIIKENGNYLYDLYDDLGKLM